MSDFHGVVDENKQETQNGEGEKRIKRPTAKGLIMMLENLQKERNGKLKEASKLKGQIKALLVSKENVSVVQQNLIIFKTLCEKAGELHNKVLTEFSLPEEERKKQETWFHTKVSNNDVFVEEVLTWLKENEEECVENAVDDKNEHDGGEKNEEAECDDNIDHFDSASNVKGQRSSRKAALTDRIVLASHLHV